VSGAELRRPEPRAEFRKRLRARLMNEAVALAEERRGRPSLARRLSWWMVGPRLRAVAVAAAIVILLIGGATSAAASSLPGDPAFGLKRAAEELEVALAPTAELKVQLLAAQSQHRLDELQQVVADRPDKAPTASTEYEAAVSRFIAAVQALRAAEPGSKHEAVEQLVVDARSKHIAVLEDLRDRLPSDAQQGIDRAIEEQEDLLPGAAPGSRPGSSARPARKPEPGERSPGPRATERPRGTEATEAPRATETPRGSRPTETPHR
jgi:uncharacterized protein DUF5667